MPFNNDDILYSVGLDTSDYEKSQKKLKESTSTSMKGVVAGVGLGIAAFKTLGSTVEVVSDGVRDFNIQARAENKLESVLRSTKNVAGLTAEELKYMASELQNVTTVGDETTIAASALLLTFTKISKEVFPEAIEAAMNMSHIMGGDLDTNVKMVGKSLNDLAGSGLTAMTRSGVQFTEQQEKMIKALASSGREMEAQKIVLAELETQFGGASRAFRNTFEGTTISIGNSLGDLSEKLGEGFADSSLGEFQTLLDNLVDASPELTSLAVSFGEIAGSLVNVPLSALNGWIDLFEAYTAGSDSSIDNPILKEQAEATTALNNAIKSSISPLRQQEILNNFGGVGGIRELFLDAQGGNIGSARTISTNAELQAVFNSTMDDTNRLIEAFNKTNESIKAGTLNTGGGKVLETAKSSGNGLGGVYNPSFSSIDANSFLYGRQQTSGLLSGNLGLSTPSLADRYDLGYDGGDTNVKVLDIAKETSQFQIDSATEMVTATDNGFQDLINIHENWSNSSLENFARVSQSLSSTSQNILQSLSNSGVEGLGGAISGLGLFGSIAGLVATGAGFLFGDDNEDSQASYNSSNTTLSQRASVVSPSPNITQYFNTTMTIGYVEGTEGFKEVVAETIAEAAAGVL